MPVSVDNDLNRKTLTEGVSEYLRRELLLSDTWLRDSFLREEEVSETLQISRGPVREAFKTLAGLGILRLIPRRGAIVVKFTPQEIEELYEVRFALESLVFDALVKNGSWDSADYEYQENILNSILKLAENDTAHKEAFWVYSNLDIDFHIYFTKKAKRKIVSQLLRQVYAQLQHAMLRDFAESKENLVCLVEQHRKILDMLQVGNLEDLRQNRFYSYFVRRSKQSQY